MQVVSYKDIRHLMKPGDVIAFGGKGAFSEVIKKATFSPVSHVGIILQSGVVGNQNIFNLIIESTSLGDGFAGVQINRLSLHVNNYDGKLWWLPLSNITRDKMDLIKFMEFCAKQEGKEYDLPQALRSRVDDFPLIKDNKEDFSKMFCSELDTAALEYSNAIGQINASTKTPQDVCEFKVYKEDYYQFLGEPEMIPNFNTVTV